MTGRLYAYFKDTGEQGLKMMLDADDDPETTPDTDYGKFAFNSNTDFIGYTYDIRVLTWQGSGVVPRTQTLVTISGQWKAYARDSAAALSQHETHCLDAKTIIGGDYTPMVEAKIRMTSGALSGRFLNHIIYRYVRTVGTLQDQISYFQSSWGAMDPTGLSYFGAGCKVASFLPNANSVAMYPYHVEGRSDRYIDSYGPAELVALVWDLPCDQTAIVAPEGTGGPGTRRLVATPTIAKMTRPGYDVADATGRQLIFDSSRIPTKIIGSGEFTIANGATYDVMVPAVFQPLSPYTYVDTQVKVGTGNFTHPGITSPLGSINDPSDPAFQYEPMTDRVRFYNVSGRTLTIRYIIFAEDTNAPTGDGTGSVLSVSEDAIQILRPGASASPSFADIILDSRMHYLPIIAEGYIPRASFSAAASNYGTHQATVTFSNSGFMPFVKYTTHLINEFVQPFVERFFNVPNAGWNFQHSQRSTVARIEGTQVTFHASINNPTLVLYGGTAPATVDTPPAGTFFKGIRYYIFGLPLSL